MASETETKTEEISDPALRDDGSLPRNTWIGGKEIDVEIYLYKNVDSQETVVVSESPLDEETRKAANCVAIPVRAKFTIPGRKTFNAYKSASQVWVDEVQSLVVNHYKLGRFLLLYHLKALRIGNEEIKIEFESRGSRKFISPDCEEELENLHPTILDKLILKYRVLADLVN